MVWGLEKLWASGASSSSSSSSSTTASGPGSTSTAPLVNATISVDPARSHAQSQSQSRLSAPSASITPSPALLARIEEEEQRSWLSPRSRKQFGLFAAGATFLLLSSRMTRRQMTKRALSAPPLFKQNNINMDISVNGPMEAVEALSIATINVLSFSMMMTGGLLWAFDISSIHDLRKKIRGGLGVDGTGRDENMIEQEFEEWLATVLDRKKGKEEARKVGIGESEVVKEHWRNERGKERSL